MRRGYHIRSRSMLPSSPTAIVVMLLLTGVTGDGQLAQVTVSRRGGFWIYSSPAKDFQCFGRVSESKTDRARIGAGLGATFLKLFQVDVGGSAVVASSTVRGVTAEAATAYDLELL